MRFSVAWMTRPVSTSPVTVVEAVREFAAILFAWTLLMVVKPLIFRAPLMLPATLRLTVLIVFLAMTVSAFIPFVTRSPFTVVGPLMPNGPVTAPNTLRPTVSTLIQF